MRTTAARSSNLVLLLIIVAGLVTSLAAAPGRADSNLRETERGVVGVQEAVPLLVDTPTTVTLQVDIPTTPSAVERWVYGAPDWGDICLVGAARTCEPVPHHCLVHGGIEICDQTPRNELLPE